MKTYSADDSIVGRAVTLAPLSDAMIHIHNDVGLLFCCWNALLLILFI